MQRSLALTYKHCPHSAHTRRLSSLQRTNVPKRGLSRHAFLIGTSTEVSLSRVHPEHLEAMSAVAMYYFQGDLGESLEYPNAFVIPNTAKPTFATFLKYFPAHEKGILHFRFRMEDSQHGYVWLDVTNKDETLPFYQDSIMAKVLRAADAPTMKRKSALRRKNLEQLGANIVTGAAAMFGRPDAQPNKVDTRSAHQAPRPQPAYSDESPVHSSAPPAPAPATAPVKRQGPPAPAPKPTAQTSAPIPVPLAAAAKDILDFEPTTPGSKATPGDDATAASKPVPASAAATVDDILDFASAPSPSVAASAAAHVPAAASPAASASVSNSNLAAMMDLDGTPTLSRAELKATRESKINEQVQRAVEEKKELDRKAQQEQDDFDAARAAHDQKLLAWSTNNKERRNIRSLLSTMHTVLWPESRWKPIGLGDLLEPRQVKLQYRKAMLVVHPDHNVNLTNEHKYIAKRVFEAVNEAYNEFTTKENV